jgi:hypothetical protein
VSASKPAAPHNTKENLTMQDIQAWACRRAASVTLVTAWAVTGSVHADIIIAEYTDEENFEYQVQYMPDLDQKRGELADGGDVHCVPTSTMNLFAYAAEWGFPDLLPGPGVYTNDQSHLLMSFYLGSLGQEMGTGPAPNGTGVNGWLDGTAFWLDGHPFVRTASYRSGNFCPKLHDAAHAAACGSLVAVCYGRFNFNFSPTPVVADDPESGHCVTMMRARSNGPDSLELWVRDPADSGDSIWVQSPWSYRIYSTVENMHIQHDWDGNGLYTTHEVTVLEYNPDAERMAIFYKVYKITPLFGYDFETVQINFHGVAGTDFTVKPPTTHFEPSQGFQIISAGLHPDLHSFLYLEQAGPNEPSALVLADRATGATSVKFQAIGLNLMTVGRDRDIYTFGLGLLRRLDMDATPDPVAGESGSSYPQIDSMQWPHLGQAIAYNDNTDEVVVVSMTSRRILFAPRSFGSEVEPVFDYVIPSTVPTMNALTMAINPIDDSIWLCDNATHLVYRLVLNNPGPNGFLTGTPVAFPDNAEPTSIDFDDRGHLLLTDRVTGNDHEVREYANDGKGNLVRVMDSMYADLLVGSKFKIARSRSNFDPQFNSADETVTPASELPDLGTTHFDCPGDFVSSRTFAPPPDGIVDAADLAYLLGEWGPNPGSIADVANSLTFTSPPDDVVDAADLAVLLGSWGECD